MAVMIKENQSSNQVLSYIMLGWQKKLILCLSLKAFSFNSQHLKKNCIVQAATFKYQNWLFLFIYEIIEDGKNKQNIWPFKKGKNAT